MSSSETNQSVRKEGDIQDQFILAEDIKGKKTEIPITKDGTVPLSFLEHAIPGTYGLKYTNPKTGCDRAIAFDEEKKAFLTPSDGWGDKKFTVIYKEVRERPMPCYPGAGASAYL